MDTILLQEQLKAGEFGHVYGYLAAGEISRKEIIWASEATGVNPLKVLNYRPNLDNAYYTKAESAAIAQTLINEAVTQVADEVQAIVEDNSTWEVKAARMLKAVRDDNNRDGLGAGFVFNCWTDEDIIDLLDEENITSMKAAVARFRSIEDCLGDVAEDICQA